MGVAPGMRCGVSAEHFPHVRPGQVEDGHDDHPEDAFHQRSHLPEAQLRAGGCIVSSRGRLGGYRLSRAAEEIYVGEISRLIDGPLAPAPCASVTQHRPCDWCESETDCDLKTVWTQVRDAIAFSRDPEQMAPILALYVNDMGREGATWDDPGEGNWISADEAWYVVGTAREGGMGTPETIPFASQEAARAMAAAEGGTVLRLAEIPDDMVLAPVEVPDAADESDFQARLRALSQQTQEAAP